MIDERWDEGVEEIASALRKMLQAESTSEIVRQAEAVHDGVSPELASQIEAFGLDQLEGSAAMFARVAMELGRALAPTAFVETMPLLATTGRAGISYGFDGLVPGSVSQTAVQRSGGVFAEALQGIPRKTAAGDVLIRHVTAGDGERLGDDVLLDRIERFAALINAARIVGAGQAMLEYAKSYVSEREQFGRPIGSFQAVGHRLANVVGELDAADLMVRKAAFTADPGNGGDGAPPRHFATMVWAKAVQAGRFTATNVHQVFGGNGFAMEYDVQLYSRRLRSWAMRGPRTGPSLADLARAVLDPVQRADMRLLWQFDQGVHIPRWAAEADAGATKRVSTESQGQGVTFGSSPDAPSAGPSPAVQA